MKIIIIHSIFAPHTRGGAETVVNTITHGLQSAGHEMSVISVGYENKTEVVDGVKVYRIKPFNVFNFLDINTKPVWLRFLWHPIDMFNDVQVWRIYKILLQEKPDVVLTHNLKGLGYYVPWLLRLMKIKNIHTIHDAQLLHPSGLVSQDGKLGPVAWLYARICRRLFRSPSVVIFPSRYIKSLYDGHGFFPRSLKFVMGNPIDTKPSAEKKLSEMMTFLYLGQVEKYKGVLELIEGIKNIGGCRLLVVGDGSALDEAKKIAGDSSHIQFFGRMDAQKLSGVWPEIDVLVNPSTVPESFGMVVVEAFAHGVPAIVTSNGGLPELIEEGKTGWVVGGSLAEKLAWCVAHRAEISEMKNNCVAAAQKYDVKKYLEELLRYAK